MPQRTAPERRFGSLLTELRRRKMWQVALAYASVGVAIAIGTAELHSYLQLSSWTPTFVIVLVTAGLPIALVLAWAYELRPEEPKPPEMGDLPASPPATLHEPISNAAPEPSDRSIVVLPFENLSPEPGNDYFSDGLTEEIITDLSHLRALRVISRTSAMVLKGSGKDVRAIGRELDVRYVLEGSVRRAGERLRVTAQLIDSRTDAHLWAERYDGEVGDVFTIQEGIARAVVEALRLELSGEEDRSIATIPIPEMQAYDAFLRARHEVWVGTQEALERAERYLASAREVAGESARLDAATAYVLFQQANFGHAQDDAVEGAERFARRALELDAGCAEAHVVLGACAQAFHGDWAASIRWLEGARELSPGDMESIPWLVNAKINIGAHEEAIHLAKRAVEADPLTLPNHLILAYAFARAGRPDEALAPARRAYDLGGGTPHVFWLYSFVVASLGDREELHALRCRHTPEDSPMVRVGLLFQAAAQGDARNFDELVDAEVLGAARRDPEVACWLAEVYAAVGREADAIHWLEHAIERGELDYPYLSQHSPFLAPIRHTERFRELMERLEAKWRAFDVEERASTGLRGGLDP